MKKAEIKKLLEALGGESADVDKVADDLLALHGRSTEKLKTDLAEETKAKETVEQQLTDANKQIQDFKNLKPEELAKSVEEWQKKYDTAKKEGEDALQDLRFEHRLEADIKEAGGKNPKAIRALLDLQEKKLSKDGKVVGLSDQLEELRKKEAYLFEPLAENNSDGQSAEGDLTKKPTFTQQIEAKSIAGSTLGDAMLQGAGLTEEGK